MRDRGVEIHVGINDRVNSVAAGGGREKNFDLERRLVISEYRA